MPSASTNPSGMFFITPTWVKLNCLQTGLECFVHTAELACICDGMVYEKHFFLLWKPNCIFLLYRLFIFKVSIVSHGYDL